MKQRSNKKIEVDLLGQQNQENNKCIYCLKPLENFNSKKALNQHMIKCQAGRIRSQKSNGRFFCMFCLHGFRDRCNLQKHLKQRHHIDDSVQNIQWLKNIHFTTNFLSEELLLRFQNEQWISDRLMEDICRQRRIECKHSKQISKISEDQHHFVLLKHQNEIVSFDGKEMFEFPRSNYWEIQEDNYSCGYRALFWLILIGKYGSSKWFQKMEKKKKKSK